MGPDQKVDPRGALIGLATLLLWIFGIAASTARLVPVLVDDSPSYLSYPLGSLDEALRSIRTPGYPLILRSMQQVIGDGDAALRWIPWFQVLLHGIASWCLGIELRRWGTSIAAASAAVVAVAIGCTFMDTVATIATDAPAASFGVLAAAAMMRWARVGQTFAAALWVAIFSMLAISLRPAYLALIPWALVCGGCFRFGAIGGRRIRRRRFHWLIAPAVISLVVLAWMSTRGVVVGDFGVLPFGHQNLSGITLQLVSDEELLAAAGDTANLADEVIRQRESRVDEGYRFANGDDAATMTIENRWNDTIYQVVAPAARQLYGDDSIAKHDAIARLNAEILSRYPLRYVRWLLLAARRAAWGIAADIVMHPVFLFGIGITVAVEFVRILSNTARKPTPKDDGLSALFVVGLTYCVIQIAFIILTTPPLGRFADAAAILIPAWIAATVCSMLTTPTVRPVLIE